MSYSRRRFCAGLLTSSIILRPRPVIAAPRPKLLIWLIAEQFRPDYLDELWPSLSPGGFRRLIEGGSYFPNCQFDAAAFTDSGLATLLTGTWPSMHGIVADRWLGHATPEPFTASAAALQAGTLFDSSLTSGANRVYVIASGAGAAFLGGCSSTRAFLSVEDEWKTAGGEGPAWFGSFRESNAPSKWRGASWLPASSLSSAASTPLRVLEDRDFPALYNASPFALANQFALTRETILQEHLGAADGLDIVAILAGSFGALGLETGASSPLMRDMALHGDEQIASLLDLLDSRVGKASYAVAFTAAHGLDAKTPPRRGVDGRAIATAVQARMTAILDGGQTHRNYVEAYLYPFLYLNAKSLQAINLDAAEARRMAARAAMDTGKIAGYYTADGECSFAGAWRERFANSFFSSRSGDVMFSYPAHEDETAEVVASGSVYNYDTRVPLVLYGPMFRARTIEETVAAIDVAPTLCRALGLGLPASTTGQVLGEAIGAPPRSGR
jgi:hypothetical protein